MKIIIFILKFLFLINIFKIRFENVIPLILIKSKKVLEYFIFELKYTIKKSSLYKFYTKKIIVAKKQLISFLY